MTQKMYISKLLDQINDLTSCQKKKNDLTNKSNIVVPTNGNITTTQKLRHMELEQMQW